MKCNELINKICWGLKIYFAYGFLMSIFIQITILLIINVIILPIYILYRPLYQWIFQRVTEVYMMYFPLVFYYINGNRIYVSGDKMIENANAIWISNHSHWVDFVPVCLVAPKCGRIGSMRYFMKDDIKKIPFIGFGFYMMDSIYLKRNFQLDQHHINETFKRFRNKYYPFWLIIFPEGTRAKPEKIVEAQKYCLEHKLPIYKNLLNPRHTGLFVSLKQLRNVVPYVYDITLGYPNTVSLASCFCPGEGVNIHMNVNRIDVKDIPEDENEFKQWLSNIWKHKDELVDYYKENGHFPGHEELYPLKFTWADFTSYMSQECFSLP
ncbi:1-acylglycerol-3-phosphate acyltransferase, putative [Entamoeba dispar SAW760]|uniref:1-acylglycerol-3-phosphate acyltransferase, putative n=1 Tax=Entamoeba dispar (strain ATCC PRA-260 / SAW760) TaxID=370354 RepID=B0E8E2_ENTDS|nr:1-acylglycerol-3-phosphate acyltransferase, putative [Entamoeba dispar SAW760]EDR29185.1 1-acylglycerol-3-phosphate acyltransferase, putative [Entamoeba dispar SAW760]|eukprot:EDR29185.1 1-acylglycerol-3-phosphate acyltransferase, putative [Entamoeba dispar SAW760]